MYKQTILARAMAALAMGAAGMSAPSMGPGRGEQNIRHRQSRLTSGIGAPVRGGIPEYRGRPSARISAAQTKRNSRKARNVARHKRHLGMRCR